MANTPSRAFTRLLQRLDLEPAGANEFVGGAGQGGVTTANRLYGGLVLAQAGVAAMKTVEHLTLHSIHAYFLRPGRPDQPIHFEVEHLKDGRNFHSRQVRAMQGQTNIFQMMASFAAEHADAPSHAQPMADAPDPDTLLNRDQARGRENWQTAPIDVRLCDPLTAGEPLPAHKKVWLGLQSALPEDPTLHTAMLLYASDRAFLSTAWRPHADQGELQGASLDHAVWLHGQVRFDDWLLYQMESPVAQHTRGLVLGGIYRRSGERVASVAQEGLLRSGLNR